MKKIKEIIKSLVSTPRRAAITTIVSVFAIGVLSVCGVVAAVIWDMNEDRVEYAFAKKFSPSPDPAAEVVTPETSQAGALNEKKISQGKATEIALADAGFKQSEVTNLYVYYEMDDGYHQYDVRFFKGELEYEYAIDADSGAVMERDMDHIYD